MQEISGTSENPYETELIKQLPPCLHILNGIEDDFRAYIMNVVYAVCEGMRMDLSFFPQESHAAPKPFDTPAELERYCRLMGGEPGDMVYCGITFGQTEEEVDTLAEKAKKIKSYNEYNGISELDTLLRNLLFNELGEDWIEQIKWVDYKSKAADKRYYQLDVIFVEGKVYAMGIDAYYL